jgi:iodotyrosine deiodinase
MSDAPFVPYPDRYVPPVAPERAAADFHDVMRRRRSVRMFSDRPVSLQTIEWLVRAAHSAPSGANKQPWRFVCVRDPALKAEIREGAEQEEREFYSRRANAEWLRDLAPLGTDDDKEFLTIAPWLVVVFQMSQLDDGSQVYYLGPILGRPNHERPFLLIPVGYPTDDCEVPAKALERRPLEDVMIVR